MNNTALNAATALPIISTFTGLSQSGTYKGIPLTIDMTKGEPLRLIARFTLPMLLGGVFQQFYNIIDMLIIGNTNGSRDLAAIGATSSATFFFLSVAMGLTVAFSIVIAQHFGANNLRMVRRSFVSSIYITAALTVVLSVAGIVGARPLMEALQTPADIIDSSVLYIQICIGGGIGLMVYNGAAAVLRGVGDSRTPLYFLILSSILNVILDLIFVLGLHMGVKGVAIATVISQIVSAALCVWYMLRKYQFFRIVRDDIVRDRKNMWDILRIGLSMGLQGLFLSVGDMVVTGVVNTYGTDVVAAYATGSRVLQLATLVFFTLSEAFAVYAGQNLGAREVKRIRQGFNGVVVIILALSVASAVFLFLSGDMVVRWFISSEDVHIDEISRIAMGFLRVTAFFYPFLGLIYFYNNTMRGMGEVLSPLVSGVMELIGKIGLSLYFAHYYGYYQVWFAVPIGWITGLIPTMISYHRGKWERLAGKITHTDPESVRFLSDRFLR